MGRANVPTLEKPVTRRRIARLLDDSDDQEVEFLMYIYTCGGVGMPCG